MTHVEEVRAAALDLSRAARWERALRLLDSMEPADVAVTAAEVALESDFFAGTELAADRLATAQQLCGDSWDLSFLRLRHDYFGLFLRDGKYAFGPDGKDPAALAELRARAFKMVKDAADPVRRGWAQMYLGLIVDNLFAERDVAPAHYAEALTAGDDLVSREALRHLGDHDRDNGDLDAALERWERATTLAAGAGLVTGTLSQQMQLAALARDFGDEAGAVRLATEIERWAGAVGAVRLRDQAAGFLLGH